MKAERALAIGALAGGAFAAIWGFSAFGYGLERGQMPSAIAAAAMFVSLAPIFDRLALRLGRDVGPRVFWSAATWTAPVFALEIHRTYLGAAARPAVFALVLIVVGAVGALAGVTARRHGFRSRSLRRVTPWLAAALSLAATIAAAQNARDTAAERAWLSTYTASAATPAIVPVLAFVCLALAVYGLFRRGGALAKLCGLDGDWKPAQMTADGRVLLEGFPPLLAPAGIVHMAGPVLVQLDDGRAATFRTTGAPTVTRLLQGIDVDVAGRRALLDEGAMAYATAAATLAAAPVVVALLLH